MKSFFKEIFSCIFSLIKEIIKESIYFIKRVLIFLIMLSISGLGAYGLSMKFGISMWLTITIGIIFLIILFSLYAIVYGDFKKPFCKIPVSAKIIDTMNINMDGNNYPYTKIHIYEIEYIYKNKTYKKKIEVDEFSIKLNKEKLDIMICKSFPKIMYVVKGK